MRIPKFRAWDKVNKEMLDIKRLDFYLNEVCFIDDESMASMKLEDVELMQSTGLTDVNGKEIFEGDILFYEYLEELGKVVYEDACYCFERINVKSNVLTELAEINMDCEVRGNIYENKELLER